MATAEPIDHNVLVVLPEREGVRLRPGQTLDDRALRRLETEARKLISRGFARLTIDLRGVERVDWTAPATLSAMSRLARSSGVRMNVIPGSSAAIQSLLRAGLMKDLALGAPSVRPFFDWSR